jgi:hypothetical protein
LAQGDAYPLDPYYGLQILEEALGAGYLAKIFPIN